MFNVRSTVVKVSAAIALALPVSLYAADKTSEHDHDVTKKSAGSGPSMEMHQSMMRGMKGMQGMKPTGDMDRDFASLMRHHHEQGVRMAEYEIKHGKDAKMREMAQKIMESQKKEIAEFDEWLKSHLSSGNSK